MLTYDLYPFYCSVKYVIKHTCFTVLYSIPRYIPSCHHVQMQNSLITREALCPPVQAVHTLLLGPLLRLCHSISLACWGPTQKPCAVLHERLFLKSTARLPLSLGHAVSCGKRASRRAGGSFLLAVLLSECQSQPDSGPHGRKMLRPTRAVSTRSRSPRGPVLKVKDEPDSPPMALGMVDRSRILLCFLTFLCLSFNPLTALLRWGGARDSDQHPSSGSGRSVLSLESGGWTPLVPPHE